MAFVDTPSSDNQDPVSRKQHADAIIKARLDELERALATFFGPHPFARPSSVKAYQLARQQELEE